MAASDTNCWCYISGGKFKNYYVDLQHYVNTEVASTSTFHYLLYYAVITQHI